MKKKIQIKNENYKKLQNLKTSEFMKSFSPSDKFANEQITTYYEDALVEKSAIHAVENGDMKRIESLLKIGVDVNVKNHFGETLLMIAAKQGNISMMNLLLANEADIKAVNNAGMTALILASSFGQLESVKLLLDKGSDIEAKDSYGRTALKAATSKGRIEVAKYLIKEGCEVPSDILKYISYDIYDYQPFTLRSAEQGHKIQMDLVKMLEEHNIPFTKSNNMGSMTGFMIHIGSHPGAKLESKFELITSVSNDDSLPPPPGYISNDVYFYSGIFAGNLVSPGIKFIDDQITGKNNGETLFDYYVNFFDVRAIAKSTIMSLTIYTLPNNIYLANKIIIGKMLGDAVISGINLTPEYTATVLAYLANSLISTTAIGAAMQTGFYQDYPFATGVIATTTGDIAKLCYHASLEGYKMILGEDFSQQNVE